MNPKFNIGQKVSVNDKRWQKVKKQGKRSESVLIDYVWDGVVTHIILDERNHLAFSRARFPLLLNDFYYYLVKQGNYHSTRVDEDKIKPKKP